MDRSSNRGGDWGVALVVFVVLLALPVIAAWVLPMFGDLLDWLFRSG